MMRQKPQNPENHSNSTQNKTRTNSVFPYIVKIFSTMEAEEESSQDILISSLRKAGVSIPLHVSSISELYPPTFVSICGQCLNLIDQQAKLLFPTSLPDATVDKFKICTDMALAIKRIGYIGDMSYYKLLYPSEEDLYKLSKFLVERLSENVNAGRTMSDDSPGCLDDRADKFDAERFTISYHNEKMEDLSLHNGGPELSNSKDDGASVGASSLLTEEGKLARSATGDEVTVSLIHDEDDEKARHDANQKAFAEDMDAKTSTLRHLEEEYELLKAATEMAFDDQHPVDYYIEQLHEQVDAKKHYIVELKSQWDALREPLEEKKKSILESLYSEMPEAQEKLKKLREVEEEKLLILSEMEKREEEYSKLSADFEKKPKLPLRTTYIERIKEITKNSRKQDADIDRILKDTRELQLESNSIRERLHRTHTVLDEMVCREAKKEPVGRQAYRRLASIHDSFEQISEKILATDRIRRETAELEKKLASMASRSLNADKLQADLDAIMKENEYLEAKTTLSN